MGIHNSSNLSTEWRVANHINMKAFMTICALLAGSALADPLYLRYSTPLISISYMGPTVSTYALGYPSLLIKREADPESPYAYEAKVVNPEDGSKYQFDVEVDRFGDGKSHQRVEQQDNTPVARDNYLMDRTMIEQNRMDRMRMDQMKQQVMEQNLNDQRRVQQMRMEKERQDQRLMYQNQMDQRQMSQNQLDQNMMDSRMATRPMMRSGHQNDLMYSMREQNEMGMMNQRMLNDNMRRIDGNRINQRIRNNNRMERGQMQSRQMMKREAGPSFAYTVSTGHPSEQSLQMMQSINYLMPVVDSIPMHSIHQVHPDGGVSYRLPSLMTYTLRPANMMTGSMVDVQQHGQSYGFRTMA